MIKESFKNLLIIAAFIGNHILFAQVVKYQTQDLPESSDFMVWVNDQKVFTTKAGGDYRGSYSFANFDFNGSVKVKVRAKHAIKWLEIMPSILNIKSKTIDDYTFEFTLDKPKKITILLNNDKRNALHLLTNSIEEKTVDPQDDNVLYYRGTIVSSYQEGHQ